MTDQPAHPLTRTIKPICFVCRMAFFVSDGVIWHERLEERDMFYHDACASVTVKAVATCRSIAPSTLNEYKVIEFLGMPPND